MVGLQRASVRIQGNHRVGVEIISTALLPDEGARIASAPIRQIEWRIITAGDPDRRATSLPGLARPALAAGFTRTWNCVSLPHRFPGLGIEGLYEAADSQLAPGDADHHFATCHQRRQG